MNTRKFREASFIDKAMKKSRSATQRHEWQNVSLTKQERSGKSHDELAELRKAKWEEQQKRRIAMRRIEAENNMILLARKVKKLKEKRNEKQS